MDIKYFARLMNAIQWVRHDQSGDVCKERAANLVAMGADRPEEVSPARWSAIVNHVSREVLQWR